VEHISDLPLSHDDCLVIPCDKEELCDDNAIIFMPRLKNKLDIVASDPVNCVEIRTFNPIASVYDELKLLSPLNTLGYIEFYGICNLNNLEDKFFVLIRHGYLNIHIMLLGKIIVNKNIWYI
jgi:hypothetical protein